METGLILLGIVAALILIPLTVSRITSRWSDEVDGYLEEQHESGGREGSWPAGGGHIGL